MRKLALFDLDNTLYKGFSAFPLLKSQVKEKIVSQQDFNLISLNLERYEKGEADYESSVFGTMKDWALILKGQNYAKVLKNSQEFYRKKDFFPFAFPLIEKLRKTHDLVLVTGQFQFVSESVNRYLNFNRLFSSTLEIKNDLITGKVTDFLSFRQEKKDKIKNLFKIYPWKGSLAFGDSEGDIDILKSVEFAFCIEATNGLKKVAKDYGWEVLKAENVLDYFENKVFKNDILKI